MKQSRHTRSGAVFWGILGLSVCFSCPARAGTETISQSSRSLDIQEADAQGEEVSYMVSFVDAEDQNTVIFQPQSGAVPEGTSVQVSFPEQIIGSDGHIWNSLAESPQEFPVYPGGVQKFFIEYQQGEKVKEMEPAEEEGAERLREWLRRAWEADCAITGQDPEGTPDPYLIGTSQEEQERRIRNLVSAIMDADWHTFYLIGKNQEPQTASLGVYFDAVYSVSKEARFTVGKDWYQIVKVRVKRNWDPDTCTHQWEQISQTAAGCLKHGSETWGCGRCGREETARIAASGHLDTGDNGLCDRCGILLDEEALKETGELLYWQEGEVQLRRLGEQVYRFVCVDEDYRDGEAVHREAALFLCDSVIRADVDSSSQTRKVFCFGEDNNYKTSEVRSWLLENSRSSDFQTEPISIGVSRAYLGSTEKGSFHQLAESSLQGYEIGRQQITDPIFLLSLEEALRYREVLWSFGEALCDAFGETEEKTQGNPESQLSAWSQGYYLRTPQYTEAADGDFAYGTRIYAVNLEEGNILPVETGSETCGIRPAFVLPQG